MLDRLVYLSASGKAMPVPKSLQQYVPGYSIVSSVAQYGISGTAVSDELNEGQLRALHLAGSQTGEGSKEEYLRIVSKSVYDGIISSSLKPREKVRLFSQLDKWSSGDSSLVEKSVATFGDEVEQSDFIFETGFSPIDSLIGGFPTSGLITFYARPGHGKSSLMLLIADSLKKVSAVQRVVWFSCEMSRDAVLYRASPLDHLKNEDLILTGQASIADIEEHIDSQTAIFVDYADLLSSNERDERQKITSIYADLLRISKSCKCLVTASQVPKNTQQIQVDSGIGSGSKAHYPELIMSIVKGGKSLEYPNSDSVTFAVLKNRYGISGVQTLFDMDYGSMNYSEPKGSSDIGLDMEGTDLW